VLAISKARVEQSRDEKANRIISLERRVKNNKDLYANGLGIASHQMHNGPPKGGPLFIASAQIESILAAGDFQQVVAELSLHRALHGVDRGAEDHGVEFLDHLAWAERTEVTALAAGWAAGVGFSDFCEISAAFDLGFEFVALVFSGNEDVTGGGFGHGE
jgi:hypothetical protein